MIRMLQHLTGMRDCRRGMREREQGDPGREERNRPDRSGMVNGLVKRVAGEQHMGQDAEETAGGGRVWTRVGLRVPRAVEPRTPVIIQ